MQVPAAGMVYALASSGADAVSTDAVLYGCKKYPMLSTFDHIAVNISCCAAYAGILYIPRQAGHTGKPGLYLPACDTAIYRNPGSYISGAASKGRTMEFITTGMKASQGLSGTGIREPLSEKIAKAVCMADARARTVLDKPEEGMATAEYAIVLVAATGFAGVLVAILKSDAVRAVLTNLVKSALSIK